MILLAGALQLVIMAGAPVLLCVWLTRRFGVRWMVVIAGAATFIASQVVHLPLVYGLTALFKHDQLPKPPEAWKLLFNAVILGLLAGLCEEWARFVTLRYWQKKARSFGTGLVLAAGHGGVESVLLGALVAINMVTMWVMKLGGLDTLSIPPEHVDAVQQQLDTYFATSPWMFLMSAGERLMAMTCHLAMGAIVMLGVIRRQTRYVWLAVAFHTALDGCAVYVVGRWGVAATEGALLIFVLLSLLTLFFVGRASGEGSWSATTT